jgi:hypothetical protein
MLFVTLHVTAKSDKGFVSSRHRTSIKPRILTKETVKGWYDEC